MQYFKLLKQYKFIIYYTPEKPNNRVNKLCRSNNYIKTIKRFNYSISKLTRMDFY